MVSSSTLTVTKKVKSPGQRRIFDGEGVNRHNKLLDAGKNKADANKGKEHSGHNEHESLGTHNYSSGLLEKAAIKRIK